MKFGCSCLVVLFWGPAILFAGPYSQGLADSGNAYDAGVPGFVGADGDGLVSENNGVNPIFYGWASFVIQHSPAPGVASAWTNSTLLLGPVTGDNFDIVSLGDLSASQISSGVSPGRVTVKFDHPVSNLSGADFVVYENGVISDSTTSQGSLTGQLFGELAYVEVSSDGVNFARFPSRSLTSAAVGPYGTIDPSNVFNLAGKHSNANGDSWGTPFDLNDLVSHPLVLSGSVNLADIEYIRLVDIPGNGAFLDSTGSPIYDAWLTFGSGGFDAEAIGAIARVMTWSQWLSLNSLFGAENAASGDPDGDGLANLLEYASGRQPGKFEKSSFSEVKIVASKLSITFLRDERAQDVVYEVQASNDLVSWTTIAKSTQGMPFSAQNGFTPTISEIRHGDIASIGVIREVTVSDVQPVSASQKRFLRVKVSLAGGA